MEFGWNSSRWIKLGLAVLGFTGLLALGWVGLYAVGVLEKEMVMTTNCG